MEIIERIYELLNKQNKRAYELCNKLGIRTSTMSTWKARTNDPPAKYMKTIADFFDVSLDYLLTGQEAPVPKTTTKEEDELLEMFRKLPNDRQQRYLGRLDTEIENYEKDKKYLDGRKRLSI